MRTYEDAVNHYNKSKAPKRSAKWKRYSDNPRYLNGVSNWHKGIHKEEATGAIYYRLYNTQVAKFYPPEFDGSRKVIMHYYSSQLTNIFMYDYGLHYHTPVTTEGKEVRVPYVDSGREGGDDNASATLWFDRNNKLMVHRSKHKDIYTMKSSTEDKAYRKQFKDRLDTLVTLALFRLEEYKANASLKDDYGAPFNTQYREPPTITTYKQFMRHKQGDLPDVENSEYVNCFLDLGQGVMDILASKKVYNYVPDDKRWGGTLFGQWGKSQDEKDADNLLMRTICNSITADEFKKSLINRVLDVAQLKTGTVKTAWGQFMDTIPHKYYT